MKGRVVTPATHEFAGWGWDGPFGADARTTYLVACSCGWRGTTFADSPETSIDSTWKAHADAAHPATLPPVPEPVGDEGGEWGAATMGPDERED